MDDSRLCRVNSGISGANVVSGVRRAGRSGEISAYKAKITALFDEIEGIEGRVG